jgi:hypothetical protein
MRRVLILIVLATISTSETIYRLYHKPSVSPNFKNENFLIKTIAPNDSDLLITVFSPSTTKYITVYFYSIVFPHPPNLIFKVPSGQLLLLGAQLIDIYWINNEYLLAVGVNTIFFYRPPFNGAK